jgi:hypothetical protein
MFRKPRHRLLLLFPALMRSGHHAIIEWIQAHFDGPRYELNDALAFRHPFRTDWYELHGPPTSNSELATINFEDVDIRRCRETPLIDLELLGRVENCRHVLVLRDPFNLLASKLRFMRTRQWWQHNEDRRKQSVDDILFLWMQMAKEFAGETDFLGPDCIRISFNQWFLSRPYRDRVAGQIGFKNQDHGVDRVSRRGDGSSFDYQSFDGRAQNMGVLNRWQSMRDDAEFRAIFDRADVLQYGETLFGPLLNPASASARAS